MRGIPRDDSVRRPTLNFILLTKSTVPVIGQVAYILGLIMDALFRFTSNFGITNIGLSIILFTIIINLLMWPMTVNQQKSSRLMSVMQPELQAIQKKYRGKTDQVSVMRMQAETKEVYAKYGTSMSGSCLFLAIQMPILFALYQVIYRIPAYVPSIYKVFQSIAEPLMQQPGYVTKAVEIGEKIRPALEEGSTLNQVIDFLYRFTPAQFGQLEAAFPSIAQAISQGAAEIEKMNYFLGVNLATAPFQGWMPNAAWIIPVLAAVVQWYSAKLMTASSQTSRKSNDDNPMAQQMQTMNTMMPLMSLFFCFTLPAGIGLYWVASGICRMIQQLIINAQLNKMNIDDIVAKNVEKANAKAIKNGQNPNQVKSKSEKLMRDIRKREEDEKAEESSLKEKMTRTASQVKDSTAYYNKNAKPGSLAAKANMVAMYDERMEEKKRNKGKKAADAAKAAVNDAADAAAEAAVSAAEEAKDAAEAVVTEKTENS